MSRRVDAHWRELAGKLPMQPCGDLQNDVLKDIYDNDMLGTGLMLYSRESVETANPIAQITEAPLGRALHLLSLRRRVFCGLCQRQRYERHCLEAGRGRTDL